MADDLTIEVTGSAEKAASALDRIIQKITDLQARFEKAAPSVSKFAADMDKIASSSRQWSSFDKMASSVDKQAQVSKKAEANMAMYQARLERANVSMERSRVSSERLAAAQQKSLAISQAAANVERLRGIIGSRSSAQSAEQEAGYSAIPPDVRAINQRSQDEAAAFTARAAARAGAGSTPVSLNAGAATAEVRRMGEYIDGLTPKIANMSAEAQAQFNALAAKLNLVSQQIDNQRMLYSGLADQAARVGAKQGEGSMAYLRLEKRMLSADAAAQRLGATQEKLQAQLSGVASAANAEGAAMVSAESKAISAGKKSEGAWGGTMRMMEKMLIRIAAFRIFSAISQGITTGINNMVQADSRANATMSQLSTSVQYIENSIAAALLPLLQALTPIIVQIADGIAWLGNQIAIFIAQVTDQKTVTIATKSYVDYAKSLNKAGDNASGASKKVKELQRTIMGFDELNVLQKNVDAVGGGKVNTPDYGSMFKTIPTPAASEIAQNTKKAFDWLKDSADKGGKTVDRLKEKVKELEKEFSKVKLPVLGDWKLPESPKVPAFPPVPAPEIEGWKLPAFPKVPAFPPVKAPIIPPVRVPALDTGDYDRSKQKYQRPVTAPAVAPALAPMLITNAYLNSKNQYQQPVAAPVVNAAIVPALVLTGFNNSLSSAKQSVQSFAVSTQQSVTAWGNNLSENASKALAYVSTVTATSLVGVNLKINQWKSSASKAFAETGANITKNMRLTFVYIPEAVGVGLNEAGKRASSWLTSTGKNFANWGENLVSNIGKTMSAWYASFVGALSSAWSQFTSFMSATGKKIGGWWDANKSWAIPTAIGIGVGAYVISAIATGGATLAAAPAFAGLANGALVTEPTDALIGEGHYDEAVLPLSPDVFSQIAKGIQANSGSSGISDSAVSGINDRLDRLASAINELAKRPTYLYTDNLKLAESSNAGNREIARSLGHLPSPFE